MTHYFFDGTGYVTPMAFDVAAGRIRLRDGLVDLRTGRRVRPEPPGVDLVRTGRHDALVLDPGAPRPGMGARLRGAAWGAAAAASTAVRVVGARLGGLSA